MTEFTAPVSAEQKLEQLQAVLKPVIAWYEGVLTAGEPDSSYLYDTTCDQFDRLLSRGDCQAIVEILIGRITGGAE